jgi:hypothetical protein
MTTAIGPPAPAMPVVATLAPTNVGATVADVAGTINPNGVSTAYHFEYGSTTAYGSLTSTSDAGTGSGAVDVSAVLSNLSPGTLYHYRLVATNAGGTVNGGDMTFTGLSMKRPSGTQPRPAYARAELSQPLQPVHTDTVRSQYCLCREHEGVQLSWCRSRHACLRVPGCRNALGPVGRAGLRERDLLLRTEIRGHDVDPADDSSEIKTCVLPLVGQVRASGVKVDTLTPPHVRGCPFSPRTFSLKRRGV